MEAPAGYQGAMSLRSYVPVPGANQAFALGYISMPDITVGYVLFWNGAAGSSTWKIIKKVRLGPGRVVGRSARGCTGPSGTLRSPVLP